jgi:tetratricopeptide (TPR) repeat protein
MLETETLAVVFEKQGKFDRAIAIYEKLISRNPEKSSTFAARIEELNLKKENK